MGSNEIPPKVFISYSQDSPEHEDRVLAFSNRLRADGFDCNLDQYIVSPPEGWSRWMDRQLQEADFVLVICTSTYFRRVMGREQPGKGHGVAWESTLIYQDIYNAGTMNTKFIPILFEGASSSDIPAPLQGTSYYSADTASGYKALCRRLRNQPKAVKPPLGGENLAPDNVQQLPPRDREHSFSREALNQQGKSETADSASNNLQDNSYPASRHAANGPAAPDPLQLFQDPVDLRHAMNQALDRQEFELLCGDLGLRYEDLKGDTLEAKMQSLIVHFTRQRMYPQFVEKVLRSYPYIADWGQL